jgi:hypothetical protein
MTCKHHYMNKGKPKGAICTPKQRSITQRNVPSSSLLSFSSSSSDPSSSSLSSSSSSPETTCVEIIDEARKEKRPERNCKHDAIALISQFLYVTRNDNTYHHHRHHLLILSHHHHLMLCQSLRLCSSIRRCHHCHCLTMY